MHLPDFYILWLNRLNHQTTVSFAGADYYLLSEQELSQEVVIDGRVSPAFAQLMLYLRSFQQVTGLNELIADTGDVFPAERVASCLTIGESHGDALFVDLNDGLSLWRYHADGADIERIPGTLERFVHEAVV